MKAQRLHQIQKSDSSVSMLLLGLCIAFGSSSAHAQVELRPQITGTAKTSAPASTNENTEAGKQPVAAIVNNMVDVNFSDSQAPSKKLRALRIKVLNRSDSPLVFDGDRCTVVANTGGQLLAKCASQKQIDTIGRPPTTFGEKVSADVKDTVTAAASIGAVQTIKTFEIQAGPIEKRYEYDHERQVNEESRFGRRLIYPGESTDGNIYFNTNVSLENGLLQIPVKTLYDSSTEATLSRPIRITTEGGRQ